MICKWCGAEMDSSMRSCPSCGRETPPFSDCGGFYDIVPGAVNTRADHAGLMQVSPVREQPNKDPYRVGKMPDADLSRKAAPKQSPIPVIISCVALFSCFVMMIVIFTLISRVESLEQSVDENAMTLIQIQEELDLTQSEVKQETEMSEQEEETQEKTELVSEEDKYEETVESTPYKRPFYENRQPRHSQEENRERYEEPTGIIEQSEIEPESTLVE